MTDSKKAEADETLRILWQTFGEKQLANDLRISGDATGVMESTIEMLVKSLVDGVESRGMRAISGSEKFFVKVAGTADPLDASTIVGAKLRVVFDERPEGFARFIAFKLSEAHDDRDNARRRESEAHSRYQRLKDVIAGSRSMRQVRAAVRELEHLEDLGL